MVGRGLCVGVLLVLAGACAGCGDEGSIDEDAFRSQLQRQVESSVETGKPFRLRLLGGREWDRVFVFGAYAQDVDITETLGFGWGGAPDVERDEQGLLVFVKDFEVVGHAFVDYQRQGSFRCLETTRGFPRGLSRSQALLRAREVERLNFPSFVGIQPARFRSLRARSRYLTCMQ